MGGKWGHKLEKGLEASWQSVVVGLLIFSLYWIYHQGGRLPESEAAKRLLDGAAYDWNWDGGLLYHGLARAAVWLARAWGLPAGLWIYSLQSGLFLAAVAYYAHSLAREQKSSGLGKDGKSLNLDMGFAMAVSLATPMMLQTLLTPQAYALGSALVLAMLAWERSHGGHGWRGSLVLWTLLALVWPAAAAYMALYMELGFLWMRRTVPADSEEGGVIGSAWEDGQAGRGKEPRPALYYILLLLLALLLLGLPYGLDSRPRGGWRADLGWTAAKRLVWPNTARYYSHWPREVKEALDAGYAQYIAGHPSELEAWAEKVHQAYPGREWVVYGAMCRRSLELGVKEAVGRWLQDAAAYICPPLVWQWQRPGRGWENVMGAWYGLFMDVLPGLARRHFALGGQLYILALGLWIWRLVRGGSSLCRLCLGDLAVLMGFALFLSLGEAGRMHYGRSLPILFVWLYGGFAKAKEESR